MTKENHVDNNNDDDDGNNNSNDEHTSFIGAGNAVIALTFTRKAAEEMKHRIYKDVSLLFSSITNNNKNSDNSNNSNNNNNNAQNEGNKASSSSPTSLASKMNVENCKKKNKCCGV